MPSQTSAVLLVELDKLILNGNGNAKNAKYQTTLGVEEQNWRIHIS